MRLKVKVEGDKLVIENTADEPVFLLQLEVKYRLHVSSIEDGTVIKYVSHSIPVNEEVVARKEIPLDVPDVSEVTVTYRLGNEKFQETHET
ncbi:hypothetical protein GWK48_09925 [Metallosphaera tengchongensis]|uniref:Uncharacterized protein n=1 Tax=Metallosphaera tengchongensis TaxID=1532350 RepID=A0A6N0P045_9CREN|nr:hypothetical protein [Metallosphaera tengchongensis]QKR00660.1 hypothetical protein GWK48_09925 [Metallosphaera tengchongensis]